MKKSNLLLRALIGLIIFSCSSDDNGSNNSITVVGTYSLSSIVSEIDLDPNVTGEFNDNELIDNIPCESTLILNGNGSVNWDYLNISQTLNSNQGTVTYSEIQCQEITGGSGSFEINYNGIILEFDSPIDINSYNFSHDTINIFVEESLVVELSGVIQLMDVQLTYIYKKQ